MGKKDAGTRSGRVQAVKQGVEREIYKSLVGSISVHDWLLLLTCCFKLNERRMVDPSQSYSGRKELFR